MRRLQLASILVVALLVGAWTNGALYDVVPQYGRVAFGSISGTSAGTANTVITLSGRRRVIICTNSLNTEHVLTYDGSNWLFLPASSSVAVDLSASGLTFAHGKVIGIYYLSAPASGSIACTAH